MLEATYNRIESFPVEIQHKMATWLFKNAGSNDKLRDQAWNKIYTSIYSLCEEKGSKSLFFPAIQWVWAHLPQTDINSNYSTLRNAAHTIEFLEPKKRFDAAVWVLENMPNVDKPTWDFISNIVIAGIEHVEIEDRFAACKSALSKFNHFIPRPYIDHTRKRLFKNCCAKIDTFSDDDKFKVAEWVFTNINGAEWGGEDVGYFFIKEPPVKIYNFPRGGSLITGLEIPIITQSFDILMQNLESCSVPKQWAVLKCGMVALDKARQNHFFIRHNNSNSTKDRDSLSYYYAYAIKKAAKKFDLIPDDKKYSAALEMALCLRDTKALCKAGEDVFYGEAFFQKALDSVKCMPEDQYYDAIVSLWQEYKPAGDKMRARFFSTAIELAGQLTIRQQLKIANWVHKHVDDGSPLEMEVEQYLIQLGNLDRNLDFD